MCMSKPISITPFKELHGGQESIYDHIAAEKLAVPDKVIAYLLAAQPVLTAPGVYQHPFIRTRTLPGPDKCTDGRFFWDRDTWKYVLKYNLILPQEFIDHVMSEKGDAFISYCIDRNDDWCEPIKQWKKKQGYVSFLPSKALLDTLYNF